LPALPAPLWPVALYAIIFTLHLVLPARRVDGYVRGENGQPLRYRLNGLPVFAVSVLGWALLCQQGVLAWDALYLRRWEMAVGACVLGLAFTGFTVLSQPRVPGWSLGKELYLGRAANPQWLGARVDAKMFLYLLGAVVLELNVLSFGAHHVLLHRADVSPGVLLYVALFTFFLTEYLLFEQVHLYTYDFVAENVGFKLGWGCFVFYPFFYAVGLWSVAELPNPHTPLPLLAAVAALFFCGWVLARGANLQKFFFKRDASKKAFGVLAPVALDGRVLISGFWGLSRHINYLGELCMASALALSLGYPLVWGPWLYPLYYLVLLVPRQLDDDRRCAKKYGPLWAEYVKRVPYRIVPFVY
jgi:protein-S-isoprenylcysteine O-methyltransferase Ste14